MNINVVKDAAKAIVHQRDRRQQGRLETAQRDADPDRPVQNVYRIQTHGHPSNLTAQVLHYIGLPMPPYKRNEDRFSVSLHPAYDQLSAPAEAELQRFWDEEDEGKTWAEIVER